MLDFTVIIPTFNRKEILKKCLEALEKQTLKKERFQVIVINDGSTDETSQLLSNLRKKLKINLIVIEQKNSGQGIARNRGIELAQAKHILFIGDDILTEKNLLDEHLKFHKKYPLENFVVLGFVAWHKDLKITPFMNWLNNGSSILGKFGGHQFAYEKLANKLYADYNFFYTANISLKTSLLKKIKFDENFGSYGWEDIELGYRMTKDADVKIIYNKNAQAFHYHNIDEKQFKHRMINIGKSAILLNNKYPELKKVPGIIKKTCFWFLSNRFSLFLLKKISNNKLSSFYFYALSKKYFLKGLKIKDINQTIT